MHELLAIGIALLLGSIPFGLLITRAAGLGDIRAIGSGNIGATNVLRTGRKDLALATLAADALKGIIAVALAHYMFGSEPAFSALAAVAGHCYSPWLNFNGGKGVATTLGALIALSWIVGLIACAVWLITFIYTRLSSLSALVSIGCATLVAWLVLGTLQGTLVLLIASVICVRHQANITRLIHGREPKSDFGRK
jgi:glycerol-3-phosphate acyltransferase PlsY